MRSCATSYLVDKVFFSHFCHYDDHTYFFSVFFSLMHYRIHPSTFLVLCPCTCHFPILGHFCLSIWRYCAPSCASSVIFFLMRSCVHSIFDMFFSPLVTPVFPFCAFRSRPCVCIVSPSTSHILFSIFYFLVSVILSNPFASHYISSRLIFFSLTP